MQRVNGPDARRISNNTSRRRIAWVRAILLTAVLHKRAKIMVTVQHMVTMTKDNAVELLK